MLQIDVKMLSNKIKHSENLFIPCKAIFQYQNRIIFIAGAGQEPEPLQNMSAFDVSLYRPRDGHKNPSQNRIHITFSCQNRNNHAAPVLAPTPTHILWPI
jgi:hypothetical protein